MNASSTTAFGQTTTYQNGTSHSSTHYQNGAYNAEAGAEPAGEVGETEHATAERMSTFGRAKLSDLVGDFVVYRNLEPLDERLGGLRRAHYQMGLTERRVPRKQEMNYAKAALWITKQAQAVRQQDAEIRELLFVGDSLYTDGQCYQNLRKLVDWRSACFIGTEEQEKSGCVNLREEDNIYIANRWSMLGAWMAWLRNGGFVLDEGTAVIMDIDKTIFGAKGRNDHAIDRARLQGIDRTMVSVLGENFDRDAFKRHYTELNRPLYHCVTTDNQDYLGYICLVTNAGLIQFDEVVDEVKRGALDNFEQFVRWVDSRAMIQPVQSEALRQARETVSMAVRQGDPTPFKRFRRQEFVCTVSQMGCLPDDSDCETMLAEEITFTNEMRELAQWLSERGCLLLCLSDKPDESALPSERASSDLLPLHQVETHLVGTSIRADLASIA